MASHFEKAKVPVHFNSFKEEVAAWKASHRGQSLPQSFTCHIRYIGIAERGPKGRIIRAALDPKLVPARGRPPPESVQEVEHAQLLDKIHPRAHIHGDGAHAFAKACKLKGRGKYYFAVAHRRNEYVKTIKTKCKGNSKSNLTGTQLIDQVWKWLKKNVPMTVTATSKILANRRLRCVNASLATYVHSFQFRYNLQKEGGCLFESLGALCKSQ